MGLLLLMGVLLLGVLVMVFVESSGGVIKGVTMMLGWGEVLVGKALVTVGRIVLVTGMFSLSLFILRLLLIISFFLIETVLDVLLMFWWAKLSILVAADVDSIYFEVDNFGIPNLVVVSTLLVAKGVAILWVVAAIAVVAVAVFFLIFIFFSRISFILL